MKAERAVRSSLATIAVLAAVLSMFLFLSGGEASAACEEGTGSELSLLCVKETTTTTTVPKATTTTLAPTTSSVPATTTTPPKETTTTLAETTTTVEETTITTIATEVLPTVITTSTTAAEVGAVEELPFTGESSGTLLGLAISLLAIGTLAIYGAKRSRSEER